MSNNKQEGVLDKKYANARLEKKELVFRYKTRALITVNYIKKYFNKKNLNILDYGAADGLTIMEIDKMLPGNNIWGIEYSEELIQQAKQMPDNIFLLNGDVMNLDDDIKKRKYDIVVALALLEHLSDPTKAIKEAKTVLKSGGIFIATSPSPFWDKISNGFLKDNNHVVDMNKKNIINICREGGLDVIDFKRFMWAPIAVLPYFGIKISPKISLIIDSFVRKFFIFNFLFVNQIVVAKKK